MKSAFLIRSAIYVVRTLALFLGFPSSKPEAGYPDCNFYAPPSLLPISSAISKKLDSIFL
jgi:hypothetical protein